MKYVGKIFALLGIVAVLGAFSSLASDLPAVARVLRFLWVLCIGVVLIVAGGMLTKKVRT